MSEPSKPLERVLDLIPVAWLALALTAYWFVVSAPADRPEQLSAPVPGLAEADRAAAPLLAALVVVGIIKYFRIRASEVVPTAWMVLALSAYWRMVATPTNPSEQLATRLSGMGGGDRAAGPLLAALLVVGIIRYFGLRYPVRRGPSALADQGRGSS